MNLEKQLSAVYNTVTPFAALFRNSLRTKGAGPDLLRMPLGETVGPALGQAIHRMKVEADGLLKQIKGGANF